MDEAVVQKKNLAKNLQILMHHYQLTETELSRRTEVGQPVIHRLAVGSTDNPKIQSLSPIANLFGLSISTLLTTLPPLEQCQAKLSDNVIFGWHAVPVFSLEDCALGLEIAQARSASVAYTDIPPSDTTYAIILDDDSMAPQFPAHTLCIIEATLAPDNDDFVVMHRPQRHQAEFRQCLYYGDDIYLKAFNREKPCQKTPEMTKHLGTMLQARRDF